MRTVGLYLSRWGFTPQKPMQNADQKPTAAVKKSMEPDYAAMWSGTCDPSPELVPPRN
uniref:Winged helix-turn helix domain-containing protein n=1 Tax=blood disease bacterium R229 TaxID=741978 RepID=G2ZKL3_9RALS|nr:hypothetical protein BDB_70001 [blood disease bacterium R229]